MSKSFRKRSRLRRNCSDSISAKVSTDGPDDDSQQGPEHTEARPRADRSSVAGCNDADLEQTAAQSPGTMFQISSRQQTSLRERERARTAPHSKDRQPRNQCQTCLKHESGKRARKLHRGKPADSEVRSQASKDGRVQQKDCAQQQVKRKHHSAERQKRGNGHPRAMQERSVKKKTRSRI